MNRHILCSDSRRGWWIEDAITAETIVGPSWSFARIADQARELGLKVVRA